ncbi:Hypothetical protein PBC10988_13840 [Planctomycetales bacterium 10988]|nr:Hypothetical protein PBC10988_13840 [Planctomycetales bacterium 10988]
MSNSPQRPQSDPAEQSPDAEAEKSSEEDITSSNAQWRDQLREGLDDANGSSIRESNAKPGTMVVPAVNFGEESEATPPEGDTQKSPVVLAVAALLVFLVVVGLTVGVLMMLTGDEPTARDTEAPSTSQVQAFKELA